MVQISQSITYTSSWPGSKKIKRYCVCTKRKRGVYGKSVFFLSLLLILSSCALCAAAECVTKINKCRLEHIRIPCAIQILIPIQIRFTVIVVVVFAALPNVQCKHKVQFLWIGLRQVNRLALILLSFAFAAKGNLWLSLWRYFIYEGAAQSVRVTALNNIGLEITWNCLGSHVSPETHDQLSV